MGGADGRVDPVQPALHWPPGLEPAALDGQVQRWNLSYGWVISARPAHPPLVSEPDFVAAQPVRAARGPCSQKRQASGAG